MGLVLLLLGMVWGTKAKPQSRHICSWCSKVHRPWQAG